MRRKSVLVWLSIAFAGSACSTDCTLIGCLNGLIIEFDKPAAAPYRVELMAPGLGSGQTFVRDCPTANSNPMSEFFPDYFPTEVTVKITTPSGTVSKAVQPKYEDYFPNGKRCGSACRNAHVAVALP